MTQIFGAHSRSAHLHVTRANWNCSQAVAQNGGLSISANGNSDPTLPKWRVQDHDETTALKVGHVRGPFDVYLRDKQGFRLGFIISQGF